MIKNTLFGMLYKNFITTCGCVSYDCGKEACKYLKNNKLIGSFSEVFFLGRDYYGETSYIFSSNKKYLTDLKIIHRGTFLIFNEKMDTLNNEYLLKVNNQDITFKNIPDDLIFYIKNKKKYKYYINEKQ